MNQITRFSVKKCSVCFRNASCCNFGTICCDACKMFFRRVTQLNRSYTCQNNRKCYKDYSSNYPLPECRACRFQRCLNAGMTTSLRPPFINNNETGTKMIKLIEQLIHQNAIRMDILETECTLENPDLKDMVVTNKLKVVVKDPTQHVTVEQWNYHCAYTTVGYLLSFDWLGELDMEDRITLIHYGSIRLLFAFIAFQSMSEKSDKLINPDGDDSFPDVLSSFFKESPWICTQLRSYLVGKMIGINIKNEEFLLLTAILFCNPALPTLSDNARNILEMHQKLYSDALLQHCLLNHQRSGPSRFAELLSFFHVINKNFENLQYATILFKTGRPHYKLYKLMKAIV